MALLCIQLDCGGFQTIFFCLVCGPLEKKKKKKKKNPKTKLQIFHPVGDNCGEDSSQLMRELEAELTHIAFRMHTIKGNTYRKTDEENLWHCFSCF